MRVVHEKDSLGMSFYFEVNGIPMFAKGTNLIPSDALLPRVTRERYVRLLDDVQAAHMNMIRVWGGLIYEDDAFFEEAEFRKKQYIISSVYGIMLLRQCGVVKMKYMRACVIGAGRKNMLLRYISKCWMDMTYCSAGFCPRK